MIAQAEQELNWNKSSLMHYITIKNLNITEKDIDDLAEKNFVENQKGDIDTKVTIDKHIANINRQINSCENSIADNMIKTNDIGREEPSVLPKNKIKLLRKNKKLLQKLKKHLTRSIANLRNIKHHIIHQINSKLWYHKMI